MKQLLSLATLFIVFNSHASLHFIDADASGLNDGSSWADAFIDIADALDIAADGDSLWIAEGIYIPTMNGSFVEDARFDFTNLSVFGGFSGIETSVDERNIKQHPTIISGEIGGIGSEDNVSSLVEVNFGVAILDGLIFQDAASSIDDLNIGGGAISGDNAFLTIRNCRFENIFNYEGASIEVDGGGTLYLEDCQFLGNTGVDGACINSSGPSVYADRCVFTDNLGAQSAIVYSEGGHIDLDNSLFYNNYSGNTGAIVYAFGISSIEMRNCTVVENTSGIGEMIYGGTTNVDVVNSIFWANEGDVSLPTGGAVHTYIKCCSEILLAGNNNITDDPVFEDPENQKFKLSKYSPCIDAGGNAGVVGPKDLANNDRIEYGTVDIGAYENQEGSQEIIYVSVDAIGANDGSSWEDAFTDLQDALDPGNSGKEVWVKTGTYYPGISQAQSFVMVDGLDLYGGFLGDELRPSHRTFESPCFLSGNIGDSDIGDDDSNIIVQCEGSGSALLSGFALVSGGYEQFGDRFFLRLRDDFELEFTDCIVGGADLLTTGIISVTDEAKLNFRRSLIVQCTNNGALLSNFSSQNVIIENSLIIGNYISGENGMIYNTPGSTTNIFNCTFYDNHEFDGTSAAFPSGDVILKNTIWNSNTFSGTFNNSDFEYCLVDEAVPGSHNILEDPEFTDAESFDFSLLPTSEAINSGNNNYASETDILRNPRIKFGTVDIGHRESDVDFEGIIFVDLNATGLNNGRRWENAYTDLHTALENAADGDSIFVAQGDYRPSLAGVRSEDFEISKDLYLFGGFVGNENTISERPIPTEYSTFNGDMETGIDLDNSYHLLKIWNGANVTLDGFKFTGAYNFEAQLNPLGGADYIEGEGGALVITNAGTVNLKSCYFVNNAAFAGGPAFKAEETDVIMDRCRITENTSTNGGAITLTDCNFALHNTIIDQNTSANGAAVWAFDGVGNFQSSNCTITRNLGDFLFYIFNAPGIYDVYNEIVYDNLVEDFYPQDANLLGQSFIQWHRSILQREEPGTELLFFDPLFVNPNNGNFSLETYSPVAELSDMDHVVGDFDWEGKPRIGNFELGASELLSCESQNDFCFYDNGTGPVFLEMSAPAKTGFNTCATGLSDDPASCYANSGNSVWFLFYAPESGVAEIRTQHLIGIDGDHNLKHTVYSGECGTLNEIACTNDNGPNQDETTVLGNLLSGEAYLVRVEGGFGQKGIFTVRVDNDAAFCEGDFNEDGFVTSSDLLILLAGFGCDSQCGAPDLNGDGFVTSSDLLQFLAAFGTICGA